MKLPFTESQFLDVFAAYNQRWWPVAALLWIASVVVFVLHARRRAGARLIGVLLAIQWLWAGAVYQLGYFSRINPAARMFAVGFVLEGLQFAWTAFRAGGLEYRRAGRARHAVSVVLFADALLYPLLASLSGLSWPRMPSFGVPCPTDLLTLGLLLSLPSRGHWRLAVIPIAWSALGGSAAIVLRVAPDYALLLAGALLLAHLVRPGPRTAEVPTASR
jgi:hypothetical protein